MKLVGKVLFTFVFCVFLFLLRAQEQKQFSVHGDQSNYYKGLNLNSIEAFDSYNGFKRTHFTLNPDCELEHIVFGWHPYWMGSAYENYQWHLLSDISFFSYEVDPETGEAEDTHGWETSALIDSAKANGVRVNLCVTLFYDHTIFFDNDAAQQTLITNLINLVQLREADGVNIDFELVPASQAEAFNLFLIELAEQMHTAIPGSQLSIALHSVDWDDIYDEVLLRDYIDLFIIMGYDYYWPTAPVAGPTGQLYRMDAYVWTVGHSISDYLHAGIPKEKLVCALPYYGYEWETSTNDIPATANNIGVAKTIKTLKNNSNGYYSNKLFDENSMCAYYNYYSGGTWHQLWIDDEIGMKYKYDAVKQLGIAGIGIWALGYDDGYPEMWELIENTFTTCEISPWRYEFYDLGGPKRDHYDNESYTFTIQPDSYTDYLALVFHEFELEAGWDSLWIFDGADTDAPLIGGYSGTTSPGLIEAGGNALTLQFYSDGATVKPGWVAEWRCSPLNVEEFTLRNASVYPNPFHKKFRIEVEGFSSAEILSLEGKTISVFSDNEIEVHFLPSGSYVLKIRTENETFVKKIIKK